MDSLIAPEIYYDVYINICLFLVLFTLLHTYVLKIDDQKNLKFINFSGYLLLVSLIMYIGLRPDSPYFGDTTSYARGFRLYSNGGKIDGGSDYGFQVFMKFISFFGSLSFFFTICAFIYIYPLYKISKQLFQKYWYYAFVMFIVSFSFYTYGVNGVRNGAAASLFLWGLAYRKNLVLMILFFMSAILFHKTLLLPIIAFIITYFYNNPKVFLKAWLFCIPVSLIMGSVFITLFAGLGFDDRLAGYLNAQADANTFTSTGFRWDFLFHSSFAVFAGWYFIYKKKFQDEFYFRLLNTYLICNGFWILVIKANFSNRFAYLSWFMMAIVIIYPVLKQQFFKNHHIMIGKIILFYFAFTYFMSYIYYEFIKVPIPNTQHTNF